MAHFLQQLFCCKDFCREMTKNCLHEGEKTAPFLRQKPAKNALFSSISRKKEGENQVAKCYCFGLIGLLFVHGSLQRYRGQRYRGQSPVPSSGRGAVMGYAIFMT